MLITVDSFPVPPEVGKIGTNSPTYIQPVSDRADGIKSFFQKQTSSPAKSKAPAAKGVGTVNREAESEEKPVKREDVKDEVKQESETQRKPDTKSVTKTEEDRKPKVESKMEPEVGDDSNAPNASGSSKAMEVKMESKDKDAEKSLTKRKRGKSEEHGDEERKGDDAANEKGGRKGGHQTKVLRRTDSDENKEASRFLGLILSFAIYICLRVRSGMMS